MDPEIWILRTILKYAWILRHDSRDVDLVEDPENYINAEIWIQRQGFAQGSWDTKMLTYELAWRYGSYKRIWPEIWILQRILRYTDAEISIRRNGFCREPWEIKMLRHGSGDMDKWMLRLELGKMDYQRILRYIWMLVYSDPEIWILQRILRFNDVGDMNSES